MRDNKWGLKDAILPEIADFFPEVDVEFSSVALQKRSQLVGDALYIHLLF